MLHHAESAGQGRVGLVQGVIMFQIAINWAISARRLIFCVRPPLYLNGRPYYEFIVRSRDDDEGTLMQLHCTAAAALMHFGITTSCIKSKA